jgi:hypothetical protein
MSNKVSLLKDKSKDTKPNGITSPAGATSGTSSSRVGPVLAQAGHFLIEGNGNLIDVSGLNIPAGSEFCAALSA